MRLSVITDEVSQDLNVALDFAARHGLQGVELRSVAGRGPLEWDDDNWRAIRGALRAAGLPACAFSAPLFKCAIDDDATRAWQLARLPIAMERAAEVGASILRGFAFWREGDMPIGRIADAYRPVAEMAERFGLTIALEAEPSVYTVSAAQLRAVLEAIAHPRVRAVWDGANLLYDRAGEKPIDGYEILKDWIAHVHIKDAARDGDGGRACPVGQGESDIPGQLARLRRDNYCGWLSLETHYRLDPLGEDLLRLPSGARFSEGGLSASEQSMAALKAMLAMAQGG